MARPIKEGLDYFPLNVNVDRDDNVFYIEAKHGIIGFGILVRLYMRIYGEYGYYCMWTEKEQYIFSRQINVDINPLTEVVNDCINVGLFNQKLFKKYNILTSNGIQTRFVKATNRREKVTLITEYMLIEVENDDNIVFVNINGGKCKHGDDNNPSTEGVKDDAVLTKIPKVKESKVKESKEKKKYKEYVSMTEKEYQKLIDDFGGELVADKIEDLDNYKGSTGRTYVSDYRTVRNWIRRDENKKTAERSKASKNEPKNMLNIDFSQFREN